MEAQHTVNIAIFTASSSHCCSSRAAASHKIKTVRRSTTNARLRDHIPTSRSFTRPLKLKGHSVQSHVCTYFSHIVLEKNAQNCKIRGKRRNITENPSDTLHKGMNCKMKANLVLDGRSRRTAREK